MHDQASRLTKVRYFVSAGLLYAASLACIGFAIKPPAAAAVAPHPLVVSKTPAQPAAAGIPKISGRPERIVIPSRHVDLTIIPGTYDATADSWTLSGYDAQFATSTAPANNFGGLTFIYGHNNNYVFGALRHAAPSPGAQAFIYTDNHRVFVYAFEKSWSVAPDDVATLNYKGPPVLLIQTCTGSLNEWRTMYLFTFVKVT